MNLTLVRIFFRFGGCLLLGIILAFSSDFFILGLAFNTGVFCLMSVYKFGFRGLWVETNVNTLLLWTRSLGLLRVSCGILFAFSMPFVIICWGITKMFQYLLQL